MDTLHSLFRQNNPAARAPAYAGPNPEHYAVIVYDPVAGRILHATARAAEMAGYAGPEELAGLDGAALFGEHGRALLSNIHDRMIICGPGMVWGQPLLLYPKGGGELACFCTLRLPIPAPGDKPDLSQIIALDPGELASTGHPLVSGPNPRFVMEAMQDNLYELDFRKRVFFYGPAFQHIFGSEGTLGGEGLSFDDWIAMVHPEDAENIMLRWRRLLKDGERYHIPYRVRDVVGNWHWLQANIHAILNDDAGRPHRVLGAHIDITPAMTAEKSATDTGERLRVIFNNVGVGIVVCDTDGVIAQVNSALALMLGRNREHFVGRRLVDFAFPEEAEQLTAAMGRLAKGGRRENILDVRFHHADGRTVWVNVKATLSSKVLTGERYVISLLDDVTRSREERRKLQYEATHDVMTGAWSRWILLERLEQHLHISQRHLSSMAFCICDLDHFKQVNDLHGHQSGDKVLCRFVEILKASVRETEVVGRYGGEEFGVVFPSTHVSGAHLSLQRALAALRREEFEDDVGDVFRVTATFGVSGVTSACTVKQVVGWADAALYEGKENGRNRVVVARPAEGEQWL